MDQKDPKAEFWPWGVQTYPALIHLLARVALLSYIDEFDKKLGELINGDQAVTFADVLELLGAWGSNEPDKDVDGNGVVDFNDLVGTLANWGPC